MSEKEYQNWKLYGVRGLFFNGRKTKRMLWFATDIGYIATIVKRKVYNNRRVSEAYTRIVKFDLELTKEIDVKLKPENGFINIGIHIAYINAVKLRELCSWDISTNIETCLEGRVNPLMYYWNREDRSQEVLRKKDVKNLILNGKLDERAWFMRADVYALSNFARLMGNKYSSTSSEASSS